MRPRLLLPLVLLAALTVPAVAHALPVAYVGPTYFTDVAHGGPSWSVKATGSTIPIDPSLYGVDPDAMMTSGTWTFSDADNTAGTVSPGIGFWPRAFTPLPTSANSRAVMGTSPAFMLAVQRRSRVDDFVVFVLDFAGDNELAGSYYTCGPAAFQPNPDGLGQMNEANGYYDGPLYGEGAVVAKRGSAPAQPPAPDELYGFFGAIGDESPYCDQARATPALWEEAAPPPSPTDDTRRTTQTEVTCNRGPDPGDPFSCVATVGDSDQRPGAASPSGLADLTATSGSLDAAACSLTPSPSSPATATCAFSYVNPAIGAGSAVPVTVSYRGSETHKPSSGSPSPVKPEDKQPDTSGDPPIVCGAAPLPACEGLIDQPGPIQTCVANVGGACDNVSTQPAPLKICIANVITACEGFTGGAVYKGEIKEKEIPIEVVCEADLFSTVADYEACRSTIEMTTEQAALAKQYDTLFHEEVRLRYAIWQAANARATVKAHPERYTVADVSGPSLQRSVLKHDEEARAANMLIDALTTDERKVLGVAHLDDLNLDAHLSAFPLYAKAPDDVLFYDPRVTSLPGSGDKGKKKRSASAAAHQPRRVRGLGPKRTSLPKGTLPIATSKVVVLKPGQRAHVVVPLNRLGRAMVRAARARGQKTVTFATRISMTSTSGRFAPTTVQQTVRAKLPPIKKKKPAKGKAKPRA